MAFHRCGLVASLVCACVWAAPPSAQRPEDEVNLVQAASRLKVHAAYQTRENRAVPTLIVDLDAEPELRWRNVTRYYKDLGVSKAWENVSAVPANFSKLLSTISFDEEYVREMKGYLSDLGFPLSSHLDIIKLQSVGYEVLPPPTYNATTGCSGLLAAMPNGTVVHGRNMDYMGARVMVNGTMLYYPEMTVEGIFMRGGKPLYTSVIWPGDIGIHTAMRFGGWSVQHNTRYHSADDAFWYGMNHSDSGGFALGVRRIMETTPDFETAVEKLYNLKLMAPSYFIVAGSQPYEGAVITTDVGSTHEANTPLVTRLSDSTGGIQLKHGKAFTDWKIIQTNDDQNKPPFDTRRPWEEFVLSRSTQDMVTPDWVFRNMLYKSLYGPVTVFTSVYVPATGYYKTVAHPENGH